MRNTTHFGRIHSSNFFFKLATSSKMETGKENNLGVAWWKTLTKLGRRIPKTRSFYMLHVALTAEMESVMFCKLEAQWRQCRTGHRPASARSSTLRLITCRAPEIQRPRRLKERKNNQIESLIYPFPLFHKKVSNKNKWYNQSDKTLHKKKKEKKKQLINK